MQKLLMFTACCILIASPLDFAQNSSKDGWGPWRYTWGPQKSPSAPPKYWSGIPFRSKCASSAGGDSIWKYQFHSRYGESMDFVEREEHGVEGAAINEFSRPEAVTIEGHALSPVFETKLHGTCDEFHKLKHELKIEVICVTDHDRAGEENIPCFQDENGTPLEFKRIPDNPRYQ